MSTNVRVKKPSIVIKSLINFKSVEYSQPTETRECKNILNMNIKELKKYMNGKSS